jgi:hypothetical protein
VSRIEQSCKSLSRCALVPPITASARIIVVLENGA